MNKADKFGRQNRHFFFVLIVGFTHIYLTVSFYSTLAALCFSSHSSFVIPLSFFLFFHFPFRISCRFFFSLFCCYICNSLTRQLRVELRHVTVANFPLDGHPTSFSTWHDDASEVLNSNWRHLFCAYSAFFLYQILILENRITSHYFVNNVHNVWLSRKKLSSY